MTSDVQERGGSSGEARENWLGGTGTGGDVPARILASVQSAHAFTVVTGVQGVAGDLVRATVDRLHAAHIETTTIEAPLPSLAALTRAISTALSVVVDTERPLVVVVRQADLLTPDAMLRLPALAGLQRGGLPVLCFLLLGKPALWTGLGTIGLGRLEGDDTAHIRLAAPAMFPGEPAHEVLRPDPLHAETLLAEALRAEALRAEPARPNFAGTLDTEAPSRRSRRGLVLIPAGIGLGVVAVLAASFIMHRAPPAAPLAASGISTRAAPTRSPAEVPAAPLPVPDLSPALPPPPATAAPLPPPLPGMPEPAPEPPVLAAQAAPNPAPPTQPVPAAAPARAVQPASGAANAIQPAPAPTSVPSAASPAAPQVAVPAEAAPQASQPRLVLPEAGTLHIILRYSEGSDTAQAHALRVARMLRDAGAQVAGPSPAADAGAQSSIGYFFNADRGAADHLAHRLPAHFVHIRTPFDADAGAMMRPGELVVTIGPDANVH